MWTITNDTPFASERCWVRDKRGAEVWLVAVKGTFLVGPDGNCRLDGEQEPVCLVPRFRGHAGASGLLYDTDLNHTKLGTDVVLNGHAHAPPGRAATQLDVQMKVGDIDKTLRVFGDRVWQRGLSGLSPGHPEPFTVMPITWERAFGGRDPAPADASESSWDERNPVGVGYGQRPAALAGHPAPNIENPQSPISRWNRRIEPVGFGAIASHWTSRTAFAGTYDDAWTRERQPLLPEDFDERFYQCAPPDQQVRGFLRGGEQVDLVNLCPGGRLSFRLPRLTLGFETAFEDGDRVPHQGKLHTVIIEPDVPRVILVWHSHLPCHHKVLKLKTTHVTIKRRVLSPLAEAVA